MKFGVVNESTTVNRFVLHTLLRNITHLAVIKRKTNIKIDILKGGGTWERAKKFPKNFRFQILKNPRLTTSAPLPLTPASGDYSIRNILWQLHYNPLKEF